MEQRIQTVESQVTEIYNMKKMMKEEDYYNQDTNGNENNAQMKNTMNYEEEHFNEGNVFNQNLGEDPNIPDEEEEQNQEEEEGEEEKAPIENTNNVPVEIFEDVGNHVEDFNNEEQNMEKPQENIH